MAGFLITATWPLIGYLTEWYLKWWVQRRANRFKKIEENIDSAKLQEYNIQLRKLISTLLHHVFQAEKTSAAQAMVPGYQIQKHFDQARRSIKLQHGIISSISDLYNLDANFRLLINKERKGTVNADSFQSLHEELSKLEKRKNEEGSTKKNIHNSKTMKLVSKIRTGLSNAWKCFPWKNQ